MPNQETTLQIRIASGKSLLIAETAPPKSGDPAPLRALAKRLAGKVHALGVSDCRSGVAMAAPAAAAIVAQEGLEPILHLVTRDRNRIALVSECLGAQALGVRNILCTTGTHQTLGPARAARNVFDLDSVQALQALGGLAADASLLGESPITGAGPYCLGAVAAPFADPLEMQVSRLGKKIQAGARFLVSQPVFDFERFSAWWQEVARQGLAKKAAFVAGVRVLTSADEAKSVAAQRPDPRLPAALVERIASKSGAAAQRAEGVAIALETIKRLSSLDGLRGFEIRADGAEDALLEVLDKSGLGIA